MALTWLQLARDGAPPVSARTAEMISENSRKIFAKPPTVRADGELDVEPAVFKPRPRARAGAAATPAAAPSVAPARPPAVSRSTPVVARPAPAVAVPAPAVAPVAVATTSSPFTFPGAVSVLNNAQQPLGIVDDDDSDDDDDTAAGVASYYEIIDELTTRHNCDAVRRMIQRFLARKTMTQTAFLRAIKVNHNSFTKFMSYSGRDKGHGNKTYHAALFYLHENEHTESESVGSGRASAAASNRTSNDKAGKLSRKEQAMMADAFFNRINNIALPEPVFVFDDCDEVRRKLYELLEAKTVTQTALMKHLGVAANSLKRFMTSKGKREGCTINVYRLAYVMFEKLRIAQGQPKTNKRLKAERENPEGYSLRRDPTHYYLVEGETLPWEPPQP